MVGSFFLGQVRNDFRATLFQFGDIAFAVKRYSRLPDAEQNSDPATRQFSDRRVVLHSLVAQHTISSFGPRAVQPSAVSKFVERLAKKLETSVPSSDLAFLPASTSHRSDPGECRQIVRVLPAVLL